MHKSTIFRNQLTLLCCSIFGIIASFVLTIEKIHIAQNPAAEPSCSINPFISCMSAISSPQSEVFGIPLTLFGIVAYAALLTFTILLMAKNVFSAVTWRLVLSIAMFALFGVHYLILLSVFALHVICPWCFGVWLSTPLIFVAALSLAPQHTLPNQLQKFTHHRWTILACWYVGLALLLLTAFWDAWTTLL